MAKEAHRNITFAVEMLHVMYIMIYIVINVIIIIM